jgi:hypothetical protein
VAGELEPAGGVYRCDDRAVYRRCASAGNGGRYPYETGLIIFGVSIALYTAFGGFRASVLNDTMQGMVMLIGTIVLLVGIVHAAGGLTMRWKRWKRSIRNWSRRRARMISFRRPL